MCEERGISYVLIDRVSIIIKNISLPQTIVMKMLVWRMDSYPTLLSQPALAMILSMLERSMVAWVRTQQVEPGVPRVQWDQIMTSSGWGSTSLSLMSSDLSSPRAGASRICRYRISHSFLWSNQWSYYRMAKIKTVESPKCNTSATSKASNGQWWKFDLTICNVNYFSVNDPLSNIYNLQHSCFINNDNFLFRYAQGQGQEYTMAFQVYYWREGMMTFREYRDSMGRNVSSSTTYYYFIIGFMIVFSPDLARQLRHLQCCYQQTESSSDSLGHQNLPLQ